MLLDIKQQHRMSQRYSIEAVLTAQDNGFSSVLSNAMGVLNRFAGEVRNLKQIEDQMKTARDWTKKAGSAIFSNFGSQLTQTMSGAGNALGQMGEMFENAGQ